MMLYESDFKPFRPKFRTYAVTTAALQRRFKNRVNINGVAESKIDNTDVEDDTEKQGFWTAWFVNFCENTSVHGIRYIGDRELHWSERIIWFLMVGFAICGIAYVSLLLSRKFSDSPLSTVVESTIYPVAEIPFPAITICNTNRFNQQRVDKAEKKFLANASSEVLSVFRSVLEAMNGFEFGAFDDFDVKYLDTSYEEIENLNFTEIYLEVMHLCSDIFSGPCWWRNKYMNCCGEIFTKQRSEYGICHSFNSAVNRIGMREAENISNGYPLRTSNYGDWSGLRIEINTASEISLKTELSGVIAIIHHPYEWPNNGYYIPSGTTTSIVIKPTYSYTTPDVKRLSPEERQCIMENESNQSMTLPGLKYLRPNCISECRSRYIIKHCNCSIDYFFPIGDSPNCKFENFRCLFDFNDIFNYEKPPAGNPYFNDDEEGMVCSCLPECNRVDYAIEVSPNALSIGDNMTLDFHYQSSTIVKYRTDVTFGWLDLMVAFGGIAGLFLGCSILSGVEILYYFLSILFLLIIQFKDKCKQFYSTKNKITLSVNDQVIRKSNQYPQMPGRSSNVQILNIQSFNDFDKSNLKSKENVK